MRVFKKIHAVPADINSFEVSKERKQQIDNMIHDYKHAFMSLGFDVEEHKDILEVLTFLVNELNKTKIELENLKSYTRDKFYKISFGDTTF